MGVRNGIYRCAGDRVFRDRKADQGALYDCSITGCDNTRHGYTRTEAESTLGYVFLTPAADRLPVYRVANPNGGGGFMNADWVVPLYSEANSADYVTDPAARDALLAQGWRDDGIAFYTVSDTTASATKTVYRIHYAPGVDWQGDNVVFFFTDGPEYDKRAAQPATEIADMGPRFKILAAQEAGSVPLHRVSYSGGFDVLAAGEARFQQVLHQGSLPLASLTWPGLKQPTRFVIEALDAGCPFPNGYIAAMHHDADIDRTSGQPFNAPSITLDEARLSSGEVFINGQHDPANRPKPDRARLRRRHAAGRSRRWTSWPPSTRAPRGTRSRSIRTTTASSSATRTGRSTPPAARRTSRSGRCSASSCSASPTAGRAATSASRRARCRRRSPATASCTCA